MTGPIGGGGGSGFGESRTQTVGLFSFHGYDGLLDEIERRLRTVELRRGTPRSTVVEGAVFVPEPGRRAGSALGCFTVVSPPAVGGTRRPPAIKSKRLLT